MTNSSFMWRSSAALLLISGAVQAGVMGAAVVESPFVGYYGGIMGGVVQSEATISESSSAVYDSTFRIGNTSGLNQHSVKVYNDKGIGAFYLGYGQFIINNKFFLAADLAGNFADREITYSNSSNHNLPNIEAHSLGTNTTVKLRQGEFDADLRPGYQFDTNSMVYGRVGLAVNQLKMTTMDNFAFTHFGDPDLDPTDVTTTYNSVLAQNKKHNVAGLRIGAGVEHYLGKNFAITADYIYTYYGKINTYGQADILSDKVEINFAPTVLTHNGLTGQSSARFSTQAALLGVKYYFRF